MPSELPSGHPGDLVWRLPLTRTLASLRAVATEQVQTATAAAARGGLFVSHLVAAGANPDKVLTGYAVATGLPSAPRYETRNPPQEMGTRGSEPVWRALLCVPFKLEGDKLGVAFAVPLPAELTAQLPAHKAYVGLEHEILHGLDTLFPTWKKHPSAAAPTTEAAPAAVPAATVPPPAEAPASSTPSLDFGQVNLGPAPGPGAPDPFALPPLPQSAPPIERDGPAAIRTGPVVPTAVPPIDPAAAAFPGAVLQPATVQLTTPSGANSPVPPQPVPPRPPPPAQVLVDATVPQVDDRFALLKGQLRSMRWPIAGAVALVVFFKLGSCVIDSGRTEVEKRGASLADGIHSANQEAAKNRAAELRQRIGDPMSREGLPPPQPLPPPPTPEHVVTPGKGTFDSVSSALAEADAASRSPTRDFASKCQTLSSELLAYRTKTTLPAREVADLHNVNAEVDAMCAREGAGPGFEVLRDRVSRALRGEPPSADQPRYQLNAPSEVVAVLGEIDAALARQDMPTACNRMGAAQEALQNWTQHMPAGPRMMRMTEVVNGDLDDLRFACSHMSSSDANTRWERIKRKLEPEP